MGKAEADESLEFPWTQSPAAYTVSLGKAAAVCIAMM
jgi:hypothetical protein